MKKINTQQQEGREKEMKRKNMLTNDGKIKSLVKIIQRPFELIFFSRIG